jgi:hypothetical protein
VAALLLVAVVALSVGPIGPGRLSHVGANALVVAPFLAVELAGGAMPVAALLAWRRRRRVRAARPVAPVSPAAGSPEAG